MLYHYEHKHKAAIQFLFSLFQAGFHFCSSLEVLCFDTLSGPPSKVSLQISLYRLSNVRINCAVSKPGYDMSQPCTKMLPTTIYFSIERTCMSYITNGLLSAIPLIHWGEAVCKRNSTRWHVGKEAMFILLVVLSYSQCVQMFPFRSKFLLHEQFACDISIMAYPIGA